MMDEDADLQFAHRAGILRRRWRWVLEGALACGAAAFLVSLFLPKSYRATTYLLVTQSKIGTGPLAAWPADGLLATFIPFVDNPAIIAQSLQKLHLEAPPYNLTVEKFRSGHYLDVQSVKGTRLLEIDMTFSDAKLAAALANHLAEGAVAFNDQMTGADTQATRVFLKKQLDEATDRLAAATSRKIKIQEDAGLENREKDLTILLGEKDRLSSQLEQLQLAAAQDESKAKSLQQSVAGEPRTLQLKRRLSADPDLDKAAEKLALNGARLSMTEESPNTTREEIQKNLVTALASAAAERAGIETARQQLEKVNAQINHDLSQLALLRSEIDRAERDYLLAGEGVKRATELFQEASVTVSSKSQDLKQIGPALVPERPASPRVLLNTIVGMLLGAFLIAALALLIHNYHDLDQQKTLSVDGLEGLAVRRD